MPILEDMCPVPEKCKMQQEVLDRETLSRYYVTIDGNKTEAGTMLDWTNRWWCGLIAAAERG